ncbi:hypothetical protein [Caenispirillum bisanense]|uniref:Homeodomain-like domain-containing protein n=1 Tax=Caenispirillum bisanense TaxID=414052 RepID=A0A286GYP9_9PROT|nr:hypothetical protein [Caenispirillum bisanense]SOE00643.1 hypothetical protein SAMN05421508_11378 [Caenispirillum bisanense]
MTVSYRQTYGYLPEPCVRLLEGGDEELMWRVVGRLGGNTVTVPVRLTAKCILVRELGQDDAARVWRIWRGDGAGGEIEVTVPRMTHAALKVRRRRLLSLIEAGVTVRDAARRLGVTERTAYLDLARARRDGEIATPQLDLFPGL